MTTAFSAPALVDGTYTLYRLSPLHYNALSPLLANATLLVHSRRLRDALKSSTLQGRKISSDDWEDTSGATGTLKHCRWSLLNGEGGNVERAVDSSYYELPGLKGIKVDLEYEKNTYKALILGNGDIVQSKGDGELHLPLLLLRMPSILRDVFLNYLATAFDSRAEVMRLSTQFIGDMLDAHLLRLSEDLESLERNTMKGLELTIGFNAPSSPDLKTLTINIRKEDVLQFLRDGKMLIDQATMDHGDLHHGKINRPQGPFMISFTRYIKHHTALDINHHLVFISKVTCGGLVLTSSGKIRMYAQSTFASTEGTDTSSEKSHMIDIGLMRRLLHKASFVLSEQ
ncbi:hypothetical protein MMC19_004679 [Ptychographa xylographoides]|nr:hypothetical protein [Ptychographa xylographoides]